MEQVTGIGPAYLPWQGSVLPLNYTCISIARYYITIAIKQLQALILKKLNILQIMKQILKCAKIIDGKGVL